MRKVGSPRSFNYSKVISDPDGWVDANKFLPADYDLCLLRIDGKKSIYGWAAGIGWDGLKLGKDDKVIFWKRQPGE
jgi:hypothetical protein